MLSSSKKTVNLFFSAIAMFQASLFTLTARAETIKIAFDPWCPHTCDPASGKSGVLIDIMQSIFSEDPEGKKIELKYEVINWARALDMARTGKINGVAGAFHSDAPDFIFPASEQSVTKNCVFSYRSKATPKSPKDLEGQTVGIVQDYAYGPVLDDLISKKTESKIRFEAVSGTATLESNFKKLISGRLDFMVEEVSVVKYQLADKPELKEVSTAFCLPKEKTFIAFSPDPKLKAASVKYAEILGKGMEKLRKSGKLKSILTKYGLTED